MKTYWDANSVPLNERNAFYLGVRAFFSVEPSLVTNGNIATDTAWVKGTGWTISGGVANYTGLGGSNLSQAIAITSGVSYSVTYTVTLSAGEFIDVVLGGTVGTRRSASGTYSEQIVAGAANNSIRFSSPGSATGLTIDNVSVQLPAANDGWFFNTPDASGHLLTSGII
jgi:hypothetical protein